MIDTDDGYGNSDRYHVNGRDASPAGIHCTLGSTDRARPSARPCPNQGEKVRPWALSDRPQMSEMRRPNNIRSKVDENYHFTLTDPQRLARLEQIHLERK